jgi:hypothetical protein
MKKQQQENNIQLLISLKKEANHSIEEIRGR